MTNGKVFVVIPAAGVGRRMGSSVPKQYLELTESGQTVLAKSIEVIFQSARVESAIIAVASGDELHRSSIASFEKFCRVVRGGHQRMESVSNCLDVLVDEANERDWVMIHDAARPCVRKADIKKLLSCRNSSSAGCILAVPVTETLKLCDSGTIRETVDRQKIWRALTPQIFKFGIIREALDLAKEEGKCFTDEAQAVEHLGGEVDIVLGHTDNIKITFEEDLQLARYFLSSRGEL